MTNIPLKQQTAVKADKADQTANKIINFFKKGWEKLVDIGLKVDPNITFDEFGNKVQCYTTPAGNKFWLKMAEVGNSKIIMKAYRADNTSVETETAKVSSLEEGNAKLCEWIKELFGEDVHPVKEDDEDNQGLALEANTQTNVQLRKVMCEDGYEILLDKIYCNCSPATAESYINTIVSSDDLIDTLSETPTVLAIVDDGSDELDVSPCSCITDNAENPILLMLAQAIRLRDIAQVAKWNAREKYQDILYIVASECDFWGELYVEKCSSCCPSIETILQLEGGTFDTLSYDYKQCIALHANALELFRGNFEEDVQQYINNYIRDYRRYTDFFKE